ncbi:phage tail fiber protein [Acetobacter sp. P5B1]|uniref:phage tail fiber protein n=1 Tax=Acetobacter sp. P5B1 TaxID=2762620 RepID=UPI001C0492CB|nr:hypothetical protein [Acetobacter sp. P5B1]
MSDYNITAANAIYTITVPGLLNAPFTLKNFSADRMFETEARELAEESMSVDGYLNVGWVANAVSQTISLQASSDEASIFDTIVTAQDQVRNTYRLGAVIQLPAVGKKYTMVRGYLRSIVQIPSAGRVLEARPFEVRWERVIPAAI